MDNESSFRDIIERLTRVEVKVDALLEKDRRKFDLATKTWCSLLGSLVAMLIAIFK